MEKELKPCPFCGGARVYFYGAEFDPKATKAWNRRYQDERQ